ncbi:MAG: T9SS type A sorting domain-containing protein [Ignavibacteriaceae bacterium]|nr:T9SS type A sorting domain-containing protein [Ignavibacteriaceae bacterium]
MNIFLRGFILIRTALIAAVPFILLNNISIFSQLSQGGIPVSWQQNISAQYAEIKMPPINKRALLEEDRIEQEKGIPFRFGYPFEVSYSMLNSGTWTTLNDGSKLWRLRIQCKGASSINFTYSQYRVPPGAKLYIYNEARTQWIGAFTHRNNKDDMAFSTGLISDDIVTLEYYQPASAPYDGIITLATVVHGYKDIFKEYPFWEEFGSSGSCNVNVNCPQGVGWENNKRSVSMILSSGGSRLCTGSLINNVRQDLMPYYLTANHCLDAGSNSWLFMFRYESPNCTNINGPTYYTLSGSTRKSNNGASDFALLLLNEAPPDSYQVHWAGWNRADVPAITGVGIHHPSGDIKKISFVSVPFEHDTWSGTPANSHWRTRWSEGVTEPGSSGSPIYDQNKRIMGQLHGGPSSCTASDKSDLYGKFSMSWDYGTTPATRLKDWLDPDNTGVITLDGWDPSIGTPDTVAPTRVSNLAVAEKTSNSVTLGWTAPLDTSYGGVKKYDIRYSTSPITDTASFSAATPVNYAFSPLPSGSAETVIIRNLNIRTKYYFALRSSDFWNNVSLISNIASDTTLFAPVLNTSKDTVSHSMATSSVLTDSVMISNPSVNPSTLEYTVELLNNTFPGGLKVNLEPVKNELIVTADDYKTQDNEVNPGQYIDGQGGPDAFGYKWIDSDEQNGPLYIWNDIASSGVELTNWIPTGTFEPEDEGYAGPVQIGFPFKFYGQSKTQLYVSSNGLILFTAPTANIFTNSQIPFTSDPNGYIAPFWDDLDGVSSGNVYYKQDPGKLTIQFTNWHKYTNQGSLTFQIVLYSNGRIMFYYNNMNATLNSATVGIEDAAGAVGLQMAYNANYVKNNFAVKISADPEWVTTNHFGGLLYNGNSAALRLEFRSEDYPAGQYSMDMKISSNDPAVPVKVIPVRLEIGGVIPVELVSFTALPSAEGITLSWSTATETNNKCFHIERNFENTGWNRIGVVNGNGTTTEKMNYSYTDAGVAAGSYSYRLVQEDFDGTINVSKSIQTEAGKPTQYDLSQNYPNPFNPSTMIRFSVPEDTHVKLELYDALGNTIATIVNDNLPAGYHSRIVDVNQYKLSSGVYYYKMSAGSFSRTMKLVILK